MCVERPFSADSLWTYNNVLKNKFNITNSKELDLKEKEVINSKKINIDSFKKEDFIVLHKYLFEDLYDFAGKLRDENVVINGIMPCQYEVIDLCLTDLFTVNFKCDNTDDMVKSLAYFYSELNVIFPFRDGNETTIRFFLEFWCKSKGYKISFNELNENDLIECTKYAFYYDTSKLEDLFKEKIKRIS